MLDFGKVIALVSFVFKSVLTKLLYSDAVADKTLLGERECMTLCYELAMRDTANYKAIVIRGLANHYRYSFGTSSC